MNIVDRAWKLQYKLENHYFNTNLSLEKYLFYCMILFFILGIGLFVYCKMTGEAMGTLVYSYSPAFYLCLGIICFVSYTIVRNGTNYK